ncbi:hypothetical protein [uncultured Jatrophihabitans sp.]|uniref:hypothetical protein n=1 Tax=uncultured Jatrophihabitans sp. TaxID=1610747 RepID=UPI0035CB6BCC
MSTTQPCALAVLAAAAVVLTACSSSGSSGSSAAQAQYSKIKAATAPSPTSSAPAGPSIDLAALHPCSLLTPADANRVGHAEGFDQLQDASTVYKLTATLQSGTDPSCKFGIADGVEEGVATFRFQPAASFHVGPNDTRTTGLGDEAYDDGDDPVVRVGNVTISATDNSFPDSFTVALIRAMIPKLK